MIRFTFIRGVLPGIFILFCLQAHTQSDIVDSISKPRMLAENGLYRSETDFRRKHLVFAFSANPSPYRWRASSLMGVPVKLITPDSVVKASEPAYWGYRCKGKDYRFYQKEVYQIVAQDSLVLYEHLEYGVEMGVMYSYHFSLGINGPILRFSRKNLKRELGSNPSMKQKLSSVSRFQNLLKRIPPRNQPFILELFRTSLPQTVQEL